jgi:hypothetical protein
MATETKLQAAFRRLFRIGLLGWLILMGCTGCSSEPATLSESKEQQEFDRLHDEQEQRAREQRQIEQGSGIMNVAPSRR